jgi:RNA polymerase sigma-70 factor (ECF subfamily)
MTRAASVRQYGRMTRRGKNKPEQPEDDRLVAGVLRGDIEASRQIWTRYAPEVSGVLRRFFGPSPDTSDLHQETFLRVFKLLTVLRQPACLRSFVHGICVRVAHDHIRSKRVRSVVAFSSDVEWAPATTAPGPEARDAVRRLDRLLEGLSANDRALFVNRYVERMKVREIATRHKMSYATTRRRIARMTKRFSTRARRDDVLAGYLERSRKGRPEQGIDRGPVSQALESP